MWGYVKILRPEKALTIKKMDILGLITIKMFAHQITSLRNK